MTGAMTAGVGWRRLPLWARLGLLYAAALVIFGVLAGPRLGQRPANEFVALAEAFLQGRLDIDPALAPYLDLAALGGRYYLPYPPAPALLYAPAVALFGRGVYHGALHWLLAAAVAPLFYLALRGYTRGTGHGEGERLWLVALLAFGTVYAPLAVDGKVYYGGQVVAVLFLCLYLAAAFRGRLPLLAGTLLGFAYLARGATLLAFPVAIAEIWGGRGEGNREQGARHKGIAMLRFALGLGVVLAFSAAYNWARFGHPLDFGYAYLDWQADPAIQRWGLFDYVYLSRNLHAALTMMPVLLPVFPYVAFNPYGLSLLVTTPLLATLPFLRFGTLTARAALLASGLILTPALFYANTGFVQYGYRYAADFLPVLIVGMALGGLRVRSWGVRALILIGMAVCLWGALLAARHPFTAALDELMRTRTLMSIQ